MNSLDVSLDACFPDEAFSIVVADVLHDPLMDELPVGAGIEVKFVKLFQLRKIAFT